MRSILSKCRPLVFLSCLVAVPVLATNAPSNLAASGTSSSQVNLSWTDNSTDETGFTFAFDTNAALTAPTYVYAGGVNTTSYAHTGRNPATTYYYRIKAEGNPDSTWTTIVGATTAPSSLAASATSNSAISLSWTGNGSNAAVIGYTYALATNSSFSGATYNWVAGNTSTSAAKTGLATATTYWLKIKAEGTTDGLDSPFGSVVTATTTPASLAGTAASSSQINLTWSGNASNANITGYTIAYATNSSFSGAVYKYVAGAGAASYSHTGLFAGTTYWYKIKAEGTSDAMDSPFTSAISVSTSSAAPNPPSGLTASTASSSQINLTWIDNSTDETGFEVKRATDSAFTQNVVWTGGIQGTSYSDTGLSASTTYYYKVRAQGTAQSSAYSSAVSATTSSVPDSIPAAPSGLTATAAAGTQINLSWTDNSSNETGFELKRATDSAFTQDVVWIGNIQGTTYANTGLAPSTTYYYKVRAEGTAGKSAYSSVASATTGTGSTTSGVPITSHFFGINAWMPDWIGNVFYNGKLKSEWANIQASGMQIMRYGGKGVDGAADPSFQGTDTSDPTVEQYVQLVDAMRAIGVEPVLQVPVFKDRYTADQAAYLVQYVNGTKGRGVKYWVIGNEPDLDPYFYTTSGPIAGYIRPFASAMKAADPSIKIIAPELSWYRESVMAGLTTCNGADDITGTDQNGRYYVDILSFHQYNGFSGAQSRSDVITTLASGFASHLDDLQTKINAANLCHSRTGSNALRIAITEANVNAGNSSSDNMDGTGATSFIGGQFWADLMGIAMQHGVDFVTFWSTVEGRDVSEELGYIGRDGVTKRPSYYHFQMMARNFRGGSIGAADDQANVKSYASKDVDQIAVLLMNQELSTSYGYTLRLDNTYAGTTALKVKVDAAVSAQYTDTLAPQSSVVLVFDTSGNLVKKIEYKRVPNANPNPPPTETP